MHPKGFVFSRDGFEVFHYLTAQNFSIVKTFAVDMLSTLFMTYAHRIVTEEDIQKYHLWGHVAKVPHAEMLRAKNRHSQASEEIKTILVNQALVGLLQSVGISQFRLWDEGLGWLAFRLIRPGPGDGYPFSCKAWGPAKRVFSVWIPIIGFSQELMIHMIPGSHQKSYPKYLPKETHFTKDEYRLACTPDKTECLRPKMNPGEAVLFHPNTIHAEEIENGQTTRFNLEFRIEPL
ncbi:MAG: hypothetical protein HW387_167 [Parachlamydiales bacterium]|nr:hypothetical protein [Parachlamydiales bacterium]